MINLLSKIQPYVLLAFGFVFIATLILIVPIQIVFGTAMLLSILSVSFKLMLGLAITLITLEVIL